MLDCTIRRVSEIGFIDACIADEPLPVLFILVLLGLSILGVAYSLFRIWWS
jgi:hypothetical protein